MNIITMGRHEVEAWPGTTEKNFAIISITDPDLDDAKLPVENPRFKGMLRLSFHDLDKPFENYKLFSWDKAQAVADFVRLLPKEVDLLVVHCEAGISRSVGMADAIADFLGVRRYGPKGMPNSLVRRLTREALEQGRGLFG